MTRPVRITRHAVVRFNERVGEAGPDDVMAELLRAREKHLDRLRAGPVRTSIYVPSPQAVFVGYVTQEAAVIQTVLARGVAE